MGNSYESLTVEVSDHVAQVTLIGPGKGNAMGPAFWAELPVAFEALDADPDVRAIVLTGSGRNFSYGLDTRLVHRRRCRPHRGGRRPLRQRRRQVLGARGEARDRRRHRLTRQAAVDSVRWPPA